MHNRLVVFAVSFLVVPIVLCGSEPRRGRSAGVELSRAYDFSSALETWHLHREPESPLPDKRFTHLARADARRVGSLPNQGLVLGEYIEEEPQPRAAIRYLLTNGAPDANWHVQATVYLMSEGHDDQGYWCVLVTEDDYWTNSHNRDTYDFGIRLCNNGVVRLVPPSQLADNHVDFLSRTKIR